MEDKKDWSFLPIKYYNLNKFYEKQRDSFWTINELDFSKDRSDWNWLLKWNENGKDVNDSETDGKKIAKFLSYILAFFSQADGIVAANLFENFQRETGYIKEAGHFYAMQGAIEMVHSEVYSTTIDILISSTEEKEKILNGIETYKAIGEISKWMTKNMDTTIDIKKRIIAFACIEGIIFSGAFCSIYWLKMKFKDRLRGLCKSNEWIARDEGLHTLFACELYKQVCMIDSKYLEQEQIYSIVSEAVGLAKDFINEALPEEGLVGMNRKNMEAYIKCTADVLIDNLGYNKLYKVENPFDWMLLLSISNKTNFFEDKVSEYSKCSNMDWTFSTVALY